MFRRSRSDSLSVSPAKNSQGKSTNATSTGSPLRLFRRNRHHRRSQSAPDAHFKAAVAEAASTYTEEKEEVQTFKRSDLRVGRLLGEGGFAQVFSVQKKTSFHKNSQKLALKQLRPEILKDKTFFQRAAAALVQESRIMTLLRGHQNILELRGVSNNTLSFFLVTDALQETLTERVQRWNETPITQERWMLQLQYAKQIAQALAFCHQNRIVYRDCKVDNVGFSDDHTIQLFDFGLARELPALEDFDDAATCSSSVDAMEGGEELYNMTICGTQRHMAPEVYNRGWYNCKADSYSWAMAVVEMITGKKPYPYMSLPVHKILVLEGGGRPNLDGFPTGLQHVLRQAWAPKIADRWSMAQVCAAMEAYIGSECSQQAAAPAAKDAPLLQDQASANNHLDAVQQQQQQGEPVLAGAA